MLPGLRHAVECGDKAAFRATETLYQTALKSLTARLEKVSTLASE